jgi:hypothetical protein
MESLIKAFHHQQLLDNPLLSFELVTFEPFGKRRKEYSGAIGRMATGRAGASKSNITPARNVKVVTNFKNNPASAKMPGMIVLQSRVTGAAVKPLANPKSPEGMSSPGGDETGEGELKTESVRCRRDLWPIIPRPERAPDIRPLPSHRSPRHPHPAHLDSSHPKSTVDLGRQPLIWGDHALFHLPNPKPACPKIIETLGVFSASRNQTEIQPNQAGKIFPTVDLGCQIANRLPNDSPSPAGEGRGEGQLNSKLPILPLKNLRVVKGNQGWLRLIKPPPPRVF